MALRFHRSIQVFPGVRINFGKTGVSTTIGVRGASITLGSSGAHLNTGIPGTGVSFRARLHDPERPGASTEQPPNPQQRAQGSDSREQAVASSPVSELTTEGLCELKRMIGDVHTQRVEIRQQITDVQTNLWRAEELLRKAQTFPWRLFLRSAVVQREALVESTRAELAHLEEGLRASVLDVDFAFDREMRTAFETLIESFENLRTSEAIWDVTAAAKEDRTRTRSAAGTSLKRQRICFDYAKIDVLKTSYNTPCLANANGGDLCIFPGFVLVRAKDNNVALIEIQDVRLLSSESRFLEEEAVPKDAKVLGSAWKKVNKDGSKDRRFADNFEVPIAAYGSLRLTSATGLNEEYLVSNLDHAETFSKAFKAYQVSLPAPQVDPSDLLSKRSDLDALSPEELIAQQPKFWEYRLFTVLLENGLMPIRQSFQETSIPGPSFLSMGDAMHWVAGQMEFVANWTEKTTRVMNEQIMPAFGPPGTSGDPEDIKEVVACILGQCRRLLAWWKESVARRDPVPGDVQACLGRIANKLFAEVDRIPREFHRGVTEAQPGSNVQLAVTFEVDLELKELRRSLQI